MKLEHHVEQLTTDMSELKDLTVELVEENVALQVENENLKRLMNKTEESVETHLDKDNYKHVKTPLPEHKSITLSFLRTSVKYPNNRASVEKENTSSFCIISYPSFIKWSTRSLSSNISLLLKKGCYYSMT